MEHITVPFPKCVDLEGQDNLCEWKYSIVSYCEYYNLEHHLNGMATVPATDDEKRVFNRRRLLCAAILKSTTRRVRGILNAAGLRDDEGDPHVIYQLILQTIFPKISGRVDEVWKQLFTLKLDPGVTLRAFNERFNQYADKLADLGCGLTDKAKTIQLMESIKGRDSEWDKFLYWLFHRDGLTWDVLQEEIANREKTDTVNQLELLASNNNYNGNNHQIDNKNANKLEI